MEQFDRIPRDVHVGGSVTEERSAAAARWRSLFAGCSRPIRAAMATMSMFGLGVPEPQAWDTLMRGLHQALPILVRMTRADPPPRMVEEVLALWVREAEANLCLEEPTAAGQSLDRRGDAPAAAADADDASSIFGGMPALERVLFNADMRASARGTPLEVRRVFHAAMVATLEQVRARPVDVDIWDALSLQACQAAAGLANKAYNAENHAGYNATGRGERPAAAKAAIKAMAKTNEAFEMAAYHVKAALAARGAANAPLGGSGSAPHSGDEPGTMGVPDDLSVKAELANMAAWVASAAADDDELEESDLVPNNSSEEEDEVEAALKFIDGQWGAGLTHGRNKCAE